MDDVAISPARREDEESTAAATAKQQDIMVAVNAYVVATMQAQKGNTDALEEKQHQLEILQKHFWSVFYTIVSTNAVRGSGQLDFSDDERLFLDMGLIDQRMLGGTGGATQQYYQNLIAEIKSQGQSGCYYLSEWFSERYQQLQLESAISTTEGSSENGYVSQLDEVRRRVLARLSSYFTGLPGVPLEVSEPMRSGDMDKAVIAASLDAMRDTRRKTLLKRHQLWVLREQVIAKARARTSTQGALRLFELLNEVYTRDWRAQHDVWVHEATQQRSRKDTIALDSSGQLASVGNPNIDALMSEARQMRMRLTLMQVIDGSEESDVILQGHSPRLTKPALAKFLPLVQAFDRSLTELPPIIIVPGLGRGLFSWETGHIVVSLRPMVGLDDSLATAFAWLRMLDDRYNNNSQLRAAYEKKFPGVIFQNDFPADYRAWLCRLSKGDATAMNPQRRAFFREMIGPDLSGPLLPANLRSIGPQTMVTICRRLEKQVAFGDDGSAQLHRRLAAIYWQQGELEAAALQFNAAMQLAPDDGETLFATGMFMRSRGDAEAANDCFRFGAERATNSMWGIYCQDYLENIV